MKIIKNEKTIERNGRIGQYTSLAGVAAMAVGVYTGVNGLLNPESITYRSQIILIASLVFGLVFSQLGNYFGIRYGRSPRLDEKLDAGLKGLHSGFNLYHYTTPASHFLIGPAGAWVLLTYHQQGRVEYKKNRWRLSGGGFLQTYMRIFGQDGLGKPDADAKSEINAVRKFLKKKLGEDEVPEIKAAIVFTGDHIDLDADGAPLPALKLKQLKEFIRQHSKTRALNSDEITRIVEVLEPK